MRPKTTALRTVRAVARLAMVERSKAAMVAGASMLKMNFQSPCGMDRWTIRFSLNRPITASSRDRREMRRFEDSFDQSRAAPVVPQATGTIPNFFVNRNVRGQIE